jgi:choline-sulfatase
VNYLLFYPDEMRAESLACYGHPVVQTPNFDRVAAEGTVFENAYSTHPVCAPSRASFVIPWSTRTCTTIPRIRLSATN